MRLKDELDVEEEEAVEEEENMKEGVWKEKMLSENNRLWLKSEPEAVPEMLLTCSEETKSPKSMTQPDGTE